MLKKEDVQKVARLANLCLSEKEEERFSNQLTAILDYVSKLSELNVDKVCPLFSIEKERMEMREDKVEKGLELSEVTSFSENIRDGLFVVPKIIE
ncbi:MAG: Asp-tRNA(Asn)/Glu-tRNA(Gln) amidotransferase subunit GatC [bacterium]|nr:Asp-tRNA(Asn)/Glu-tRNA(Gln) amidotransferase subunit GatC [bacterium]